MEPLHQFALLLILTVGISYIVKIFRQPIIIGYVLSGMVIAVLFHDLGSLTELMSLFSEIGIMFLLFLMGIEFDLKSLKYLGKDIIIATSAQSALFFGCGLLITSLFPFSWTERVYLSVVLMFSSTLLVAKWVEDKKETATLHGKIILSTLIIQDIFAIIAITILDMMQEQSLAKIVWAPLAGTILIFIALLAGRYFFKPLFKFASRYPELLFIFSISICFIFVELATLLDYSATIGAFIAGLLLGNTIYKTDIYARLNPLIIFFNMLFFVALGFQIDFSFTPVLLWAMVLFLVAILLVKPCVIYFTLRRRGYDSKTSAVSGISLAQVSEFGIIIIIGGVTTSSIQPELRSFVILLTILTMIASSYLIKYDKRIFSFVQPVLKRFDAFFISKDPTTALDGVDLDPHIVLFGYYEFGRELVDKLRDLNKKILVIENDPESIALLKKDRIPYLFSTVSSPEFFDHVHFKNPELVVSNKMDLAENKMILKEMKARYPSVIVMLTAKRMPDALELYRHDADYVIYPSYINEQQVSLLLQDYTTDVNKLIAKKVMDLTTFKRKAAQESSTAFQDIDSFIDRQISQTPFSKQRK